MKNLSLISILLLLCLVTKAQRNNTPDKPKLVVGIVIEQMRFDCIERYWSKYGEGGFKKLVKEGAFCKNANYQHFLTQSASGYATISTGTYPAYHGIVSNTWYSREEKHSVDAVKDSTIITIGSGSEEGLRSAQNLMASTIGDELMLTSSKSKVISISLRDYGAILSGGHRISAAYWFDRRAGKWISSSYFLQSMPKWVGDFNDKEFPKMYLERKWEPILNIDSYTESLPDDNPYETGFLNGEMKTFPYDLSKIDKQVPEFFEFVEFPYANTFTKDFALAAIMNEELGKDDFTDIINVSFSTPSYITKHFGVNSVELEDIYLRLDQDLAHFIRFLEDVIGKDNVVIYLTSDHGATYDVNFLKDKNMPYGTFNTAGAISLLKMYLVAIYGKGDWISSYKNQQFYINRSLLETNKIPYEKFEADAASLLWQFTGIYNVLTASNLNKRLFISGIPLKAQNNYYFKRSGDLFVDLAPGWVEEGKNATNFNSAYKYDAHVPLIWYGWKIKNKTILSPVDMVDIAPTISSFINCSQPNACQGKPIQNLID